MSPRYYQGASVHGPVRASTATTFEEVVALLRTPATLGVTRAAFLALDKKKRNEIKQVPFFVAAAFRGEVSKRVYSEATVCNLLFIDIDEDKDGRCPAAPFVNNPENLYTALGNLNFAAYVTASSTPEKPRMRVVVDADAIPVSDYPTAVRTIAAMLGLTKLTTESKVAVQPMFLPTEFRDSKPEDFPVIAHRFDASTFKRSQISDNLSDEYEEPKQAQDASLDALAFLRAPVPEINLTVAKEALESIDADCSYFDWLECAAALKHQFSPNKSEEAFNLFDKWSSGGSKYGGEDETRAKWDSLRPTPIGRVPVTIRSLLRQATASGWNDKRVKETCFARVIAWLDEVETVTQLMEKGVHKILATPLLSAVQEDVLIHQLCITAKKRFIYPISSSAIKKDIARVRAEMKVQAKPSEKLKEPFWAKGVCYISAAQDFFRVRTGEKYKAEAFNSTYARHLLPTEDALKVAGIPVTPATLSKPIVQPDDYALNHLKIPTVYDYAYDPSQPTEMLFVNSGRKYVNTYSPTYPECENKAAGRAGDLFQAHLGHLIAECDHRETLTNFMAYMVQFPGRKIRWAVLVQSVEGAGKTYLAEVMKAVLGVEHVKTISGEAIKKGWNEWSFGSQLVVLEEVRVAGTNRYEIMNALKPLVTNDDISINQRNRDTRQVANISNYMLFSNHHDALALSPGDRRYFVLKSPLQHKSQVLALGENYFPPLFAMLRDNPGALRAYFMDWEISADFRPDGHAPRTKYVTDLINDSASDLSSAVRRLITEADYPLVQYDIVSAKTMIDILQNEEGLNRVTSQQLAQVLREEGFRQIGRHMFGSERHYLWLRNGVPESGAVDTAAKRLKMNVKNLCMEMIYG